MRNRCTADGLLGDAVSPPNIVAAANFTKGGTIIGDAVFDANIYIPGFGGAGLSWWDNQNNFYRQIRNFNFDLTNAPNDTVAVHWQVAQATGLQNLVINMRAKDRPGNKQIGIRMENGSGGFFSDITINGGMTGMSLGSQQFTSRKITINNAGTAIFFIFNWVWLFAQTTIANCDIGFDMSNGGFPNQATSQLLIVDSAISASLGVLTVYAPGYSGPQAAGSLMVERVDFTGSRTAIAAGASDSSRVILAATGLVPLFAQGNAWTSAGQDLNGQIFNGTTCTYQNQTQTVKSARELTIQRQLAPIARPAPLVDAVGQWVGRVRPQYEDKQPSDFLSAKAFGLKGDGLTGKSQPTHPTVFLTVHQMILRLCNNSSTLQLLRARLPSLTKERTSSKTLFRSPKTSKSSESSGQ
jgi:glucan 1,3-beta-glucosidase